MVRLINRIVGVLIVALVLPGVFAGCQQADKSEQITIAFVGYSTNQPFWVGLRDAAQEQTESMGIHFIDLTAADPDPFMQKQAVDNAIGQRVDGIILGAVDNRAFQDSLDKAHTAGIPVVAVDTAIDHPWIAFLVQTDNLEAAKVAGDYIVKNMKPGKVLINGGTVGHQTGDARRDGVKEVVEAAGHEVIFRACDWQEDITYETTLNELSAHPDITAIFNACDPMALSAISAVKEKGRFGDLLIVGFDGNPANLKAIKAGDQDADIKQDNVKMGQESVINLVKIIQGEEITQDIIPIEGILVTQENVDQFLEE